MSVTGYEAGKASISVLGRGLHISDDDDNGCFRSKPSSDTQRVVNVRQCGLAPSHRRVNVDVKAMVVELVVMAAAVVAVPVAALVAASVYALTFSSITQLCCCSSAVVNDNQESSRLMCPALTDEATSCAAIHSYNTQEKILPLITSV